jgi:RsiW-degrading membrane proteinase PrsW (M82 family)
MVQPRHQSIPSIERGAMTGISTRVTLGRRRRAAIWSRRYGWLAILLVGGVLFDGVRRTLIDTGNPNLVPSLILLGAAVVPAAFVAFVYGRRLAFTVSGGALACVAVLGGVIGVVIAGLLEFKTLRALGTLPMIAVAVIEETAKLIVPAILLLAGRYRTRADGLLIGVASGAGFAALETMGYAFVTLILSHGDLNAVDKLLLIRGVLSPAGHMAWTGLTAAVLWQASARGWSGRWILACLVTFAAAVAAHTAWDSLGTERAYGVLAALGLGALAWTTHRIAVHSSEPDAQRPRFGASVRQRLAR